MNKRISTSENYANKQKKVKVGKKIDRKVYRKNKHAIIFLIFFIS